MQVIHDLICENDHMVEDAVVDTKVAEDDPAPYGLCKKCQAPYTVCWLRGQPPATDVLGVEHWSDTLGISYTSTRHRDQQMKARGFEPADNVRGGPMSQSNQLPKRIGGDGRARFGGDS